TTYLPFEAKVQKDKEQRFEVPNPEECNNFKGNAAKLDPETGIIPEGTLVQDGDILIGKTQEVEESTSVHRHRKQNVSVVYDHPWPGRVHLVQTGVNGDGYDYVKVMVAQERKPTYG